MIDRSTHIVAVNVASAAGEALGVVRSNLASDGSNAAAIRAEGDRQAHEVIVTALTTAYPQDPILSEEAKAPQARLTSRRVWIVDPLDGTREFGEVGRTDWAVHIALVLDGTPVVGAVALPALKQTFSTAAPPTPPTQANRPLRIVVSRTRPPLIALELATQLTADLVEMGSAGAKAMAVVLGEADIYVHAGGQYEWDSAAPVAVATAAGLHVSRIDGTALRYNQPNPWLPDLLICRKELATDVLAIIKRN